MSLIHKLIDAVVGNCDTANLDRTAAYRDILDVLKSEDGQSHHFRNEETGVGVVLNIAGYEVPQEGTKTPLNGAPVPPEFNLLFNMGMGDVIGIIRWPQEGGVIRVIYENGFELGFIPAINTGPDLSDTSPSGRPH